MSQLQVTTFEANTLSANVITSGQTTVNSTGVYLSNSGGVINSSAISVTNSTSGVTALAPTISAPGISIGGAFYTTLPNETVNTQIFTANGTWVKPTWANTGNELVITHLWGGGGSGDANTVSCGGGGGAFVFGYFKSSQVNATCNVVVGLGGTTRLTAGGNSIFWANTTISLTAYGGGYGIADASSAAGGSGGGWLSKGSDAPFSGAFSPGGAPLGGVVSSPDSTFGGGGATTFFLTGGGRSIYGGGGASNSSLNGGSSIYGGGAGAGAAIGGSSVYGGSGGNNTVSATAPGGGGGGGASTLAGARGEVRVYTLRYTGS
jgi:hypothetical protein